ncbi:putative SWI/SNF-related matrix-associated actin-dependent regulator of chromatin subfamily A member 3-like 3 isoform X2 [Asparagus officinalis]|uniref:putative SWI/SNF-related matrix-associated actin-dependent regulator of chromatin subfamily A member 3-like 3 isoform X2 n=1 Tax=Asparagus officinalis TaxID=4686 RepID=UPI00098E7CAF|nr:putative SWI/SNF-related matrix-associated actin-dependent regulator of chromatin subfamily A member 3-like 3 isoform X2 [Asparagus officinalis]
MPTDLADAMGLGKTVMTISLIFANQRGRSRNHNIEMENPEEESNFVMGGTLIVCPMALCGQWKDELETHSRWPGSISVFIHYGCDKTNDPREIAIYDVVLTTYGVLQSSFKSNSNSKASIFHRVNWYRVVLDETHTIKSLKAQVAQSAFAPTAYCRWCLIVISSQRAET